MNINKNDKIIIKDNLIEELKRLKIEIADEEYYKNLIGTEQTAYCIWKDKEDSQEYITIDLCLEIPIQCVKLVVKSKEEYYIDLIENEKIFALCKKTIKEDEDIICEEGVLYPVVNYMNDKMTGECFILDSTLEADNGFTELQIHIDDEDFEIQINE